MDSDKQRVPQYLDEPFKIAVFTIDELIAFLIPLITLFIFGRYLITGFFVGGVCVYGLRKLKGEEGHYFLFSFLYWYLPEVRKMKFIPPSYQRDYIG